MKRAIRCCISVFLSLILASNQLPAPALAQATIPAPAAAPIPPQIASSHSVFLSNLGSDANFPADPDRVYTDIYKALAAWGHYRLASSPDQADLIFQLRDVSTFTTLYGTDNSSYTVNNPTFELTIVDPKSGVTLWTIDSPVSIAGNQKARSRWLAISETNLVSRIKVVAGEPLAPLETADLITVPNYHHGRTALIVTAGTIAFGVGGGFLLHHFYEDSLASQKASQDAFCNANHIPLSECAGG